MVKIYQKFKGTIEIINLGSFEYEGHERDWNILGNSKIENKEFQDKNGTLFEIKIHTPKLKPFANGESSWVAGTGGSKEEALEKAKFSVIAKYVIEVYQEIRSRKAGQDGICGC